jgi:ABC-2 type transport system ATP-binding protein
VSHIKKSFGAKRVLEDVSFRTESGRALGLLGRNGAGKTTTLRILTDIFRAESGEVLLDGAPISYAQVRMGYLPEERGLYPKVRVGEQMIYIGRLRGMTAEAAKKSAASLLEALDASQYWAKKLETLSKGNQQKIQLAVAVLHDPDIIILDEPFSGLDPVNAQIFKDLINQQVADGKIVIFSSHQMPYVEEFCQHICILSQGSIVLDGRIKDIKKSYTRNRIAITPESSPEAFLELVSLHDEWPAMTTGAVYRGETLEVTLRDAGDKQRLFTFLETIGKNEPGLGLDAFGVIEPTLEEIFVHANTPDEAAGGKVGGA